MTNVERIDDYLANRLSAEEKTAFERALEGDPALKSELALQEQIIKGIQKARSAELKHMLQQVPVPPSGWSPGQIAAGVLVTGVIATSLYFYFRPEEAPASVEPTPAVVTQPEPTPAEAPAASNESNQPAQAVEVQKPITAPRKKEVKPVQKPDIQITDPSAELTEASAPEENSGNPARAEVSVSKVEVITMAPDKKYSFHYQFTDGKLRLYGPFDRNLYEILEINGEGRAVFLFYKENYYLLDEAQYTITQLAPIRDGQLLKKLRSYRSK